MPSLCGLWLKTRKYLKSFVPEPSFLSVPAGQAAQPSRPWIAGRPEWGPGNEAGPRASGRTPKSLSATRAGRESKLSLLIFGVPLRRQMGLLRMWKSLNLTLFIRRSIRASPSRGATTTGGHWAPPVSPSEKTFSRVGDSGGLSLPGAHHPLLHPLSDSLLPLRSRGPPPMRL